MSRRRTVVVTGASGGVGRGIALACAEAGWEVWIAARRDDQGHQVAEEVTARGGRGHYVRCDVTDPSDVDRLVANISTICGTLHGVVHNATSGLSSRPHRMVDTTPEDLHEHASVALTAMYLLARATFPLLAEATGAFVVITSEAGFEGKPRLSAYAAVKAAQRGFARVLAQEWGAAGVRVNCIAPLAASPAMTQAFKRDPTMHDRVMRRIPLGRLGDAEADIGPVVRFLLSDDARFVTSQTVMADGGSCVIT